MRRLIFVGSIVFASLAAGCSEKGGIAQQDASVYVPSGTDSATDAGNEAETSAGFGLGQIDRAGRPLVAVLLVPDSLKDEYNAAATFDSPLPRTVGDALASRLHALDIITLGDAGPDQVDWPLDGGTHPLVAMLATDVLLVDTALPCTLPDGGFGASYLDIEREILPDIFGPGAKHTTCGGRTPGEDVVDEMLTLLVTADRDGGRVSQGVVVSAGPAATFPYLAPPNAH